LLIPEGKQGAVILPKEAEAVPPSSFSHCSLVDTVSVEDGSAAFASENGLLYTSDLTTLLRVPAGAAEVTIREGCTVIAAGALEACANLTTINAPATVTSISLDVFHAIPTVSLPAASAILGGYGEAIGAEESNEDQASDAGRQITAMVALSSTDDDSLEVDPADIMVALPDDADAKPWEAFGFAFSKSDDVASLRSAQVVAASSTGVSFFFPHGYGIARTGWHGSGSTYNHWWRAIHDQTDYNWRLIVGSGTPNYMFNNGIYDHWLITANNNAPASCN